MAFPASLLTCALTPTFSFHRIPAEFVHDWSIQLNTECLEALVAVSVLKYGSYVRHVTNQVIPHGEVCFVLECLNDLKDLRAWYETSTTLEGKKNSKMI